MRGIGEADGNSCSLINFSGDRLETKRDLQICDGQRIVDSEGKPIVGPVRADLLDRTSTASRDRLQWRLFSASSMVRIVTDLELHAHEMGEAVSHGPRHSK